MKKVNIKKISPFNDCQDISTKAYILKKVLAFIMIYAVASLIGEVLVIGLLYAMGYDALHGEMPMGQWGLLIKNYGLVCYLLLTLVYCAVVEKRKAATLGYNRKVADYIVGGVVAILLLAVIVGVCCLTGAISWNGLNENVNVVFMVLLWFSFVIQSAMEETMCRGFLMKSLMKKTSVPAAILVSSTAFVVPHLPTLLEADAMYALVGVVNLYLVSIIFSLLMLRRSNIWIACGLHGTWNFVVNGMMGLVLSGSETNADSVMKFGANGATLLNGGVYGIEASVVTTVVLAAVVVALMKCSKNGRCKSGIQ